MRSPKRSRIFRHNLQRFFAQPLKRIRRSPRLVGAAAVKLCAGHRHLLGNGERLISRLHRARSGDHRHLRAADGRIGPGETDDGVLFLHVAADQFIRLRDPDDLRHAGQLFDVPAVDLALVSGDPDSRALRPWQRMGAVPQRLDMVADRLDFLLGCQRLHHDKHRGVLTLAEPSV